MKPIPISATTEDTYYIRIRGVTQGPFNESQLQALVRRGDLARIHEISTDKKHWVRAEEYPQFFVSAVPVAYDQVQAANHPQERAAASAANYNPGSPAAAPAPAVESDYWYYYDGAASQGPLEALALKRMLAAGQLTAEQLVCRAGATQWSPIKQALQIDEPTASPRRKRKKSTTWQWYLLPLIFVVVLLISLWLSA
jgi:hypothetical protein